MSVQNNLLNINWIIKDNCMLADFVEFYTTKLGSLSLPLPSTNGQCWLTFAQKKRERKVINHMDQVFELCNSWVLVHKILRICREVLVWKKWPHGINCSLQALFNKIFITYQKIIVHCGCVKYGLVWHFDGLEEIENTSYKLRNYFE